MKHMQKLRSHSPEPTRTVFDTINLKTLTTSSVKLEHMITLSVLKSTRSSGSVKKMLHAPSLKLYAVKVLYTPILHSLLYLTMHLGNTSFQSRGQAQFEGMDCNLANYAQ